MSDEPRYRARLTWPKTGEWFEIDEFSAQGLFLDLDYDVEAINDEAIVSMWGTQIEGSGS